VTNLANIIFDNNAPVVTNVVSNWVAPVPLGGTLSPDCTQVFYGYDPLGCASLTATGTGGIAPYTYSWNTGQSGSGIQVCPNHTTTYYVTITDAAGCSITLSSTVNVTDVRCGNNNNKVRICHILPNDPDLTEQKCIQADRVAQHLAHGDFLGYCDEVEPCTGNIQGLTYTPDPSVDNQLSSVRKEAKERLLVYPNPTQGQLQIVLPERPLARLEVRDLNGRILQQLSVAEMNTKIKLDTNHWNAGIYLIIATFADDGETITERVIRQ
jgi:hypothetical protein